jgi:hypothetical protein
MLLIGFDIVCDDRQFCKERDVLFGVANKWANKNQKGARCYKYFVPTALKQIDRGRTFVQLGLEMSKLQSLASGGGIPELNS